MTDLMADRYEIRYELPAQGPGRQFVAYDSRRGHAVMLDVLELPPCRPAEQRRRRRAIARVGRRLHSVRHRTFATVFDITTLDDRVVLATEIVDDPTVDEVVTHLGPPGPPEARRLLTAVAEALSSLHAAGRAHGSIGPGTVHWDGAERIRVRGTGVVGLLLAGGADPADELAGRVAFLAPEQLRGEHPTAETDVFGWGLLGHRLLGGPPTRAERPGDVPATVRAILAEPVPAVDAAGDPVLATTVSGATAIEPVDRWRSGGEVVSRLRGRATLDTQRGRDPRQLRVRPAGVLAIVLLAALVASGIILSRFVGYGRGEEVERSTHPPSGEPLPVEVAVAVQDPREFDAVTFFRVPPAATTCADLRADPETSTSVRCAVPGSILASDGQRREAGGTRWLRVHDASSGSWAWVARDEVVAVA